MKALLIALAFLSSSGFLAAQTEGTPPPATVDEKLTKFGSIIAWSKARQAYDEGMKAFRHSKGEEAIAKFTEALSHIDRYTDARFARGRTYYEMRKWAPALEDLTRVAAELPGRADGHYQRGPTP